MDFEGVYRSRTTDHYTRCSALHQVHQDVEDGPDEDDEEPEHVAQHDARVFFGGIDAGGGSYPEVEQEEDGGEYVEGVEPDDRVEHGAIQARCHTQTIIDQPDPFEPLHRKEDDAQHARDHQPPRQLAGRVLLHGAVRPVHGVAAYQQKHRVYARDPDGQPRLVWRRPVRHETRPQPEQDEQQRHEEDELAGDEEVHAQDFHGHARLRFWLGQFCLGLTGLSGQGLFLFLAVEFGGSVWVPYNKRNP